MTEKAPSDRSRTRYRVPDIPADIACMETSLVSTGHYEVYPIRHCWEQGILGTFISHAIMRPWNTLFQNGTAQEYFVQGCHTSEIPCHRASSDLGEMNCNLGRRSSSQRKAQRARATHSSKPQIVSQYIMSWNLLRQQEGVLGRDALS